MPIFIQCEICGSQVKLLPGGAVEAHPNEEKQPCLYERTATSPGPDKVPPVTPEELARRKKKMDAAAAKKAAIKKYKNKRKQDAESTKRINKTLGLKDPPKPKIIGVRSIVSGGLPGQGKKS